MPDLIDGRRPQGRRLTRRARVAAVALTAVLVAAACGGGGDDAAEDTTTTSEATTTTEAPTTSTTEEATTTTAAPEGVCEMIAPLDIEAAVHVTVEPGVESTDGGATVCSYETADGTSQATIALHDPVGELLADTLAGDPNAEVSPGVSDEAVIQLELGTITVRRGERALVINVVTEPAPTEVALVQLARGGAGHL